MNKKWLMLFVLAGSFYAVNGQRHKKSKTIFYYVDAICEKCNMSVNGQENNYYLVTTRTYETYRLNKDSILPAFKKSVAGQYPFLTTNYLDNAVIRWQNSLQELNKTRENMNKKMALRNYKQLKVQED
jgi:hypothetical protein